MAETLVNKFLLGADPELILLDPPRLINGMSTKRVPVESLSFYGWDHNGFVLEPHPVPSFSVRQVLNNIKKSLDLATRDFPNYRFRAGAYYKSPGERSITMGGHIHLDLPNLEDGQIRAMDNLTSALEGLDILPSKECTSRVSSGAYGAKGDIRREHGHVEYRSQCSWLFSRRTSMLCLTGIKLAAVAPTTVKKFSSNAELLKWFEGFKGKDDDVDWILNRGYFSKSLVAKPDNDVKEVWNVTPEKADLWIKELPVTRIPDPALLNVADRRDLTNAADRHILESIRELRDLIAGGIPMSALSRQRLTHWSQSGFTTAARALEENAELTG